MTVRTWITLSLVVLVALSAAMAFQLLRPAQPPAIVVHAGDVRVEGEREASCWPRRSGAVDCEKRDVRPREQTIPGEGSLRIVFAYPGKPKSGYVRVRGDDGETVISAKRWTRKLDYDLDPGDYVMTAQAGEGDAYVRYVFALTVTRDGS